MDSKKHAKTDGFCKCIFATDGLFSNNGVTPPKNDGLDGFCDVFWVPMVSILNSDGVEVTRLRGFSEWLES